MSAALFVTDCRDHVVVEIETLDPSSPWRTLVPPWPAGVVASTSRDGTGR